MWAVLEKFVLRGILGTRVDSRVVIIVGTVLVSIISYGLSVIYQYIWKKVDKRVGITKAVSCCKNSQKMRRIV